MTEIVFILDRSGSMADLTEDTVGGFNSMLKKQKEEGGDAYVSTVLFNDRSLVLHDRVPIRDVPKMTLRDYEPRGTTALLDAVGGAITHIGNIHKYARKEDIPDKTLFIITTDGLENASHQYSFKAIKAAIDRQKEKYGWEFLFLGANIDAAREAGRLGIDESRAVNYHADGAGTARNFQAIDRAVTMMRRESCIRESWREDIDRDYQERK